MPCARRPRQAPSTIVAHSELDAAGRHGCSGNPLANHAAQRAQTSWAAHHVRVSASIHLWTRCCALMADTSRDLMIFQAWPTRNNKHPAFVVLSLSRLWQVRSLGNPHSEKTASIAAACTRAVRSIRAEVVVLEMQVSSKRSSATGTVRAAHHRASPGDSTR
jgi:hypothetical protein